MSYSAKDHTFVVCAYGESPYLKDCLESISCQEAKTNVIISTTTPNDYIQSLSKEFGVSLFVNEGEPSISADWNRALSHVCTSLATIAHQDDVYLPMYTSSVIDFANQADKPLIIFTDYGELRNGINEDEIRILKVKRRLLSPLRKKENWSSVRKRRRALSLGCSICCPSVTFNLDYLKQPIFDTNFKCDLDWQTWERLSVLEGSFVYCDRILMRHRIHQGSETTALIKDDTRSKEDFEMLKKFWPLPAAALINSIYSLSQISNS